MVSISSLRFDESVVKRWHLADNHERGRGWMDVPDPSKQQLGATLTIDWNPPEALLPLDGLMANLQLVRDDRKQKTNAKGMTLLEHDVVATPSGLHLIRVIEKRPMEPSGMAYYGTLTLLNEASGFLIQMWCFEQGMTGMRDSLVLATFPSLNPEAEDWGGWMIDPYGFGKQPLMHNVAELAKYDEQFPDHPLSRLRRAFAHVVQTLTFDPDAEFFGEDAPGKPPGWLGKLFGKK